MFYYKIVAAILISVTLFFLSIFILMYTIYK